MYSVIMYCWWRENIFKKKIKKYIKLMYCYSVDVCNCKYKKICLIKKF